MTNYDLEVINGGIIQGSLYFVIESKVMASRWVKYKTRIQHNFFIFLFDQAALKTAMILSNHF